MRAVAPLLLVALTAAACTGAGSVVLPEATSRCDESWAHTTTLLRGALEDYLEGMRRYAAARDGASTAPAEARARVRAAEWEAAHREAFERSCHAWEAATRRCVAAADSAPALHACGQGPLVTSFTDEVVAPFAASPLR